MGTGVNKQASRFIGTIPEHYDRFLGPRLFSPFAEDLAARVAQRKPSSVLELAAGTGIVTRKLRDQLPVNCTLTASDLNQPMLDMAMSKFEDEENVVFQTADASQLIFDDAQFDCVVCQFGVMFFPDKQQSYEEVLRVLRPGGHYIFNVWGAWASNSFAEIAHNTVTGFFPDNPPGFYRVPFSYHDLAAIAESMLRAGFANLVAEPVTIRASIPSILDLATGLVFGNPLHEEIISRDGDPDEICAAVADALERDLGTSMSLHALVIAAEKPTI